ncbi:MAG: outer membrane protein assembly factor BamB [Burkholderiales bacterium]|nr:outer membrane protein assembly factor BamB [Burkholderiales bacterium]
MSIKRPGLLLLALLTGACSGLSALNPLNWWGNPVGAQPTPLADIKPTLTIAPLWRASVGAAPAHRFAPAIAGGTVFAAGQDGSLAAFDAADGKQKWRVQANRDGLSAGVGADRDTVVVATIKGEVLAFDAAGREKWKTRVTSEVLAVPLVSQDLVIVRSNDNRLFALDAIDGRRRWVYQRAAPALVLRNFAGMTAADTSIFAGFPGGRLVALNRSNGSVRWDAAVAQPRGATELERIADLSSAPAMGERAVCAVAFQGRVACFDPGNGQPLWAREMSSHAGIAVDTRYAFVSDDRSAVVGLAAGSGSSLWRQDRLLHRGVSAPLSLGRAVIVGDYQGVVHALAREDGTLIGRAQTDGGWIGSGPLAMNLPGRDAFIVQTRSGGLFAFSL